MRIAIVHGAALALFLGSAAPALAQIAPPAPPDRDRPGTRGYISVNGGAQLTRSDFTRDLTFPLYGEDARVEARHDVPAGPLLDVGGGVRIAGGLAAGAAVTWYQQRGSATIDARLPHPLLPDTLRPLDETVVDLDRVETAVHAYVAWLVPAGDHVTIAVFGGPSFFRLEQDVVSGLELDEVYPFDEVALERAQITREKETAPGFNVGADFMYRLTTSLGVGGVARYSRATADVGGDDLRTGGLQLSGGLRVIF